jgi:general secretion pathway protein A
VQTILLGQPQFRPMLARRDAEQLRQRVLASFHLGPMSDIETRLYIEHRLHMVGWTGNPHWDPDAIAAVHRHSGGIPRRINTLCSRVLQFGALDERTEISGTMVDEVAEEMSEALNGVDASGQVDDVSGGVPHGGGPDDTDDDDDANGYPVLPPRASTGEAGDLLHRIEALEEVTARQDRIFQRIIQLLAAAVEKRP